MFFFYHIGAVIETVAYTALSVISLVFLAYNNTLYAISRKLLNSSFFTIVWVFSKLQFNCFPPNFREQKALARITSTIKAVNYFFLGRVFQNEPTHEAFARKKYMPEWFFRSEDREAMIQKINPELSKEWIQNYIADEINLDFLRNVEYDPILLKDVFLRGRFLIALKQHVNEDEQYAIGLDPLNENTAVIDGRTSKEVYQCAISLDPLDDKTAVQDPTTKDSENPTFYKRLEIERWLERNSTSPITRCPLLVGNLIRFNEMKLEYQNGIRETARRSVR